MTSGYEEERKSLSVQIVELKKEINTVVERNADVKRFLDIVHKYTKIDELTYENDKPVESISYFRQIGADVTSIAR